MNKPLARLNHLGQPIGNPIEHWEGARRPRPQPINGRFCELVPMDADKHATPLFEAFEADRTGKVWTYLSHGPFANQPSLASWLTISQIDDSQMVFTILDRKRRPVGMQSLMRIDPPNGSIEIGNITFAPSLQRTAAATEAVFLFMREAFDVLGYRRFEWKCDVLNAPSRKAALRLGFTFEGIFRNAMVYKGRNRDTAWFSVTSEEWPEVRATIEAWLAPENFAPDGKQRRSLAQVRTDRNP